MGEIYLGPTLLFRTSRTDLLGIGLPRIPSFSLKVGAHFIRFVRVKRTGMGFLLEDTSQGQRIKDGPALDLHFSSQVVDSDLRLVHPSSRYLTGLISLASSRASTRSFISSSESRLMTPGPRN
jgi:hypothetical protein